MSSTGSKRKLGDDDAMLARTFLKEACGVNDPDMLDLVPGNGTVKDIKQYLFMGVTNWAGELSYRVMAAAEKHLAKEPEHYEDRLDAMRIVYYGTAKAEMKVQASIEGIPCLARYSSRLDGEEVVKIRKPSISLVLGCSGSGKTTFCIKQLGKDHKDKLVFRVYMYAHDILGNENNNDDAVVIKFEEVLRKAIQDALEIQSLENHPLELILYAIIDEAGGDKCFGKETLLHSLKDVVCKFATDGRLVVSGTGLDLLTCDIGSVGELITKVRMLPWTLQQFRVLAAPDGDRLGDLVEKYRLYTKMISNARSASCLLEWLNRTSSWGTNDEIVAHVVRSAAYAYINGNGLRNLDPNSRRKVVRAVLQVLHECMYNSMEIPSFHSLSKQELKCAWSLVDVHVSKMGGTLALPAGQHYAVSVTPAIVIVLAALLCTTASLQGGWSEVEATIALHELFKLVREEKDDVMPEFQIVQLDKPYDARGNRKRLEVPVMSHSMVLVNGPKASYADVIAPFRLIQVKHCQSGQGSAELDIESELKKLGLLKNSSREQKLFAMAQYKIWTLGSAAMTTCGLEQQHLPESTDQSQQQPIIPTTDVQERGLYPANLLLSDMEKKKPACWVYMRGGTDQWFQTCPTGGGLPVNTDAMFDRVGDLHGDRAGHKPVTVVFVTNGSQFQIYQHVDGTSVEQGKVSKSCVLFDAARNVHECTQRTTDLFHQQLMHGVIVELAFARSC